MARRLWESSGGGEGQISSLLMAPKQRVFYRPGSNAAPSRLSGCGQGQVVFTAAQHTRARLNGCSEGGARPLSRMLSAGSQPNSKHLCKRVRKKLPH